MYFTEAGLPHWQSITEELRSADMPLRRWLSATLPNTAQCFADFRKAVQPRCIEPPPGVPAGTAGAAFDYLLRYAVGTKDPADLAIGGAMFSPLTRVWSAVVADLAVELLNTADRWKSSSRTLDSIPPTLLVRGCWALALLTELFRGVPVERSPLASVGCAPTTDCLLELAPETAIDDLVRLYGTTWNTLLPFLSEKDGAVVIGPGLSRNISGDADLIKGRTLIELKASVGRRTRDGAPRYSLDARTLYQLVIYGLLGHEVFQLSEVAIFNARYSHLYSWSLPELVVQLAGMVVSVDTLSAELDLFLRDPCSPEVPAPAREAARQIRFIGEPPSTKRRRERFLTTVRS